MNNRTLELAKQAGFQSYITTHEEDVAMFEKFAELIVKECIDIAHNEGDDVGYLKDFFGVEE